MKLNKSKAKMARLSQICILVFLECQAVGCYVVLVLFFWVSLSNALFACGSQLVGLPPDCRGALFSPHVETPSAMAIQRSSTSKSLVKVVVAAALGMLLSKSGSLPPVAVGPSTIRVYHYTNKEGHEGIVRDGIIKPSDIKQGDASYGSWVYVTQLDPSTPPYTVLHNNYDRDGGINGRGEDKMDRADYVFVLDLPECSVKIVDTRSRSVLLVGGGEAVPVWKATHHGPAKDVALELKREQEFKEKSLSQDSILAKAWQLYRYDVKLVFVYMDNHNYQKKLNRRQTGKCSRDVPAVVSNVFPLNAEGAARSFEKNVLVMLTSDGKVPGSSGDWEQCIFHGDIDRVESEMVRKLEQWTKLWVDLNAYPRQLDFLQKLRREVLARDCESSRETCLTCLFAASSDKSKPIEHPKNSWLSTTYPVNGSISWLRSESMEQRQEGNRLVCVYMVPSNCQKFELKQCLLCGDIEQVESTLESWRKQNSRVTGSDLSLVDFCFWKKQPSDAVRLFTVLQSSYASCITALRDICRSCTIAIGDICRSCTIAVSTVLRNIFHFCVYCIAAILVLFVLSFVIVFLATGRP